MKYGEAVAEILRRVTEDLTLIADRPFRVAELETSQANSRPAVGAAVQISFKLGFQHRQRLTHGCLVMPLADAISLASYVILVSDEGVKARRALQTLDNDLKDSLMEVGKFIAGAVEASLRGLGVAELRVGSESCQGVRPHEAPSIQHESGLPLWIGRAKLQLAHWPVFEALLVLPEFEASGSVHPAR